jgi:hypothetical protein
MSDELLWKRRFLAFMGVRLLGLAIAVAGVAIIFTDLLRPGGWPVVGVIVMVLGLIDAVAVPSLIRRRWARTDRE